jgi:hypothetical protein
MKKIWLVCLATIAVLLLSFVASAMILPSEKRIDNSKADKFPPGLQKVVFIHYKKGYGKPPWAGGGEKPKDTACYDFIAKSKPRWQWTEDYYYVEGAGLDKDFVGKVLTISTETWDSQVTFNIFGNGYYEYHPWGVYDGYNAINFGDYEEEGVIAVTAVWFQGKTIYEYDVLFDTDYAWGDATTDSGVMDLQNIATHELGHAAGLGDLYDVVCSDETMYGYSEYGETKKRTLEDGDITGIHKLYGS